MDNPEYLYKIYNILKRNVKGGSRPSPTIDRADLVNFRQAVEPRKRSGGFSFWGIFVILEERSDTQW